MKKRTDLHMSNVLGLPYYKLLNSTCKKESVIHRQTKCEIEINKNVNNKHRL